MGKIIKRTGLLFAAPFFIVLMYLFAALLGGVIPSDFKQTETSGVYLETPVYLTANAMHADIALPVNSLTLQQFAFLREAGFPLDNPNLQYLIVGWGSKEFYASTANYSDMKLATIWRAATGDNAVMHIAPGGDLSKSEGVVAIDITEAGFAKLIDFMLASFDTPNGNPVILPGATFGYGDVFYEAKGWFNIFNPCNVWASNGLKAAGLSSGIWTPTTYSLLLNHKLYN